MYNEAVEQVARQHLHNFTDPKAQIVTHKLLATDLKSDPPRGKTRINYLFIPMLASVFDASTCVSTLIVSIFSKSLL